MRVTSDQTPPIEADSVPRRPVRIGAGRAGPVRRQLRLAVEDARAGGRMTVEHEVRALLAERYADLVDRAARDVDGRGLLVAGERLLELLDTLPVRASSRGGDDDSGSPRGKLLRIMDGAPQVGDSADS